MAISVNSAGLSKARSLISSGAVDKTSSWSFSAEDGNKLLGASGDDWGTYASYFLAEDTAEPEKSKARYKYPFGKGGKVYRSGVVAIRSRAGQQNAANIESAAGELLTAIDGKKSGDAVNAVYKAAELKAVADGQYQFVASDESTDRMGDVIRVAGWDLANYKRNPIVLFQHQSSNPVGVCTKTWVDGKALMSQIKLAAQGTSPFIDTLRSLLAQGIIKAVSVGFRPTKDPAYITDDTKQITGLEFVGQELLEISLVSVPANANALAMAKSMHIPDLHLQRIFAPVTKNASVHMMQQKAELEIIKARVRRFEPVR